MYAIKKTLFIFFLGHGIPFNTSRRVHNVTECNFFIIICDQSIYVPPRFATLLTFRCAVQRIAAARNNNAVVISTVYRGTVVIMRVVVRRKKLLITKSKSKSMFLPHKLIKQKILYIYIY